MKIGSKNVSIFINSSVLNYRLRTISYFLSLGKPAIQIINLKATNGLIIKEENLIGYDGNFIVNYNYLDYKLDTIYQTNSYDKIVQCQEEIIGILKGNSDANSIFISK